MANFSRGPGNPEATRESQEQQGKTLESKGTIPDIERVTQTLIEIHGGLQRFLSRLENYPDLKVEIENILKKIIEIRGRLYPEKDFTSPEELKIFTEELPQLISSLREILNNLKRLNLKEYIIIAPETSVNLIDVLINEIEKNLAELEKNIPRRGGWTRRRVIGGIGAALVATLGYLGFRELHKSFLGAPSPTPPPTETPTATIPPTATQEPTATATQEPTATATATPEQTPTPNIFEIIEKESVNFANKLKETLLKSSESFKNNEPFFAKVLELLSNDEEFLEIIQELYKRLRFSGFELTETWEPFVDSESFLISIIKFKNPYPLELEINKEILDKELNELGPNQSRTSKLELDVTYWTLFIAYPSFWLYEAKLSFALGCSRCDAKTSNGKLTYFLEKTGTLYLNVSIRKEAQKSLKPDEISYLIRETIKRIVKSLPKPPKKETQNGKQNE